MERIENKLNEQCYIVSLDNGIRKEEPITIDVYNDFSDGSQLVQLNKTVFGVFKKNSLNPETMYIDDYDIIKADIAELLDIDHEETRRIVNEEGNLGVFTILNYSKDMETRISATSVLTNVIDYINKGILNNDNQYWISETLGMPATSKGNAIKDRNQIENIINLGITSLITEIELKSGSSMSAKAKDSLIKSYIRMILFDYIIGRKYRGLDYSLVSTINNQGNPIWLDARLGPISISNSIEKDNQVGDNEYLINNYLVDRQVLIDILFEKYYKVIKKTTIAINDAIRLYRDAINRIIYNNTDIERGNELEDLISSNINKIINLQKAKEKSLGNDNKINKVERTMATQSLNVRVTAKLDLIQKKYPINPKDHMDLLKEPKKKKVKKENVNLIVEQESNSKAGFANAAILVSAIALICGIGTGIIYVLLTLGN